MCGFFKREIETLASKLNCTFPVKTSDGAKLMGQLLGRSLSPDTFKRRKNLYNCYLRNNNIYGVGTLGRRLTLEQIESLYNFLITFREADRKDNQEIERGEITNQAIPKSTFNDYLTKYTGEYSIRIGHIKADNNSDRLIFTPADIALISRVYDSEFGIDTFKKFRNWPTTHFIKSFANNDGKNIPCNAKGHLSYEELPRDSYQQSEVYPIDKVEVSTLHLRLFINHDSPDHDISIDQRWVMRLNTDLDSDGHEYTGDYYFIYDSSLPRGEVKGKLTLKDGQLLFDGSYHEKGKSINNWPKIYFRVFP